MARGLKIAGVILVLIVLILIYIVKGVLEPMIKTRVDNYISATDSEFYSYRYKTLSIDLFGGSLNINEVEAIPSQASIDSLKIGAYDDIDQLFANEIYISINYLTYLTERQIEVSEVKIINPEIVVYYFPEKSKNQRDPVALNGIFSDDFQGFQMKSLVIEEAKFTFQNILKEKPDIELDSVTIRLLDIEINPETLETKPLGIGFKKIEMETGYLDFAINEYYGVHFDELSISIEIQDSDTIKPLTNILLKNVSYQPNEFAIKELKTNKLRTLSRIKTNVIEIKNFQLGELLLEKKLNLQELIIQNPEITQVANSKMKKESKRNPLKFVLKKYLETIIVNKFRIENGTLNISDIHKSQADLVLAGVNFELDDILLNDSTDSEPLGIYFSRAVFTSSGAKSDLGEYYKLATGPIKFDLHEGNISLSDIKLSPKQTREEFSTIVPFEQDQFDLAIKRVYINNLDMAALNQDLGIRIKSVEVDQVAMHVFRDKYVEDNKDFVYKPLPSSAIRNIKIPVLVELIKINNSLITYTQLGDVVEYEDEKPGTLTFNNLSATAYNFTNIPGALKKNPEFVVDATTKFMNTSELTAKHRFIIPDTTDLFYVTAQMDSFPTIALDPMVKNLLLVSAPDGMIHRLEVDMTGNEDIITGKVSMEYENLNVDILKANKPKKSSGFLNTIANGLIRKNNRRSKNKFVIGLVNAERNKNKAIFNFTWNGIKTGLMSTVVPFVKKEKTKKSAK